MMSFSIDDQAPGKKISIWLDVKGMQQLLNKLANLKDNDLGHIHLFEGQNLDSYSPYNQKGVSEVEINYSDYEIPPEEYAGPPK